MTDTPDTYDTYSHHAHRVPVPDVEPLLGTERYDYADSFEARLRPSDQRSAEEIVRGGLEGLPAAAREAVSIGHRHVLRLQLAPKDSADHVVGWKVVTSEQDVLQLEAVSPRLGRAVLVIRRLAPARATFTTYLFFQGKAEARPLWRVMGPIHRRVAPRLLEAAAGHPRRADESAAVHV